MSAVAAPRASRSSSSRSSSARRAWTMVAAPSPVRERQTGAVDRDPGRQPAELLARSRRPCRPVAPSSERRRRRRASAPRPGGVPRPRPSGAQHGPAKAMHSTGRTRTTSSGSASSQLRSGASLSLRAHRGSASSTSAAAPSGSPPAIAWRIASDGSPLSRTTAGPAVQLRDQVRLLVEQSCVQDVGEEVVVAVPPTLVVERDQEQVAAFQASSIDLPAGLPGDRVAERAVQPRRAPRCAAGSPGPGRTGAAPPPRPGSRRRTGRRRRSPR